MKTYIKDVYRCLIHWGFQADYVRIAYFKDNPRKFTISNKVAVERGVKDGRLFRVRPLQAFLDNLEGPNQVREEWEDNGDEETKEA